MNKVTRTYGDTSAINFLVSFDGVGPIDLSAYTTKITIEQEDGTAIVTAATTGLTAQPTQTFTLDSTNNWIYCAAHGIQVGDVVIPMTNGSFSGTGLTASTRYVVVERDFDWFRVSNRSAGAPVTIAAAGTPTHSIKVVGSGQYLPQSTYAVGIYRAWILLVGTTTAIVPEKTYGFQIEIVSVGN